MDELGSTTGLVALLAGGVAVVSLVLAVFLAFRLRSLKAGQRAVLGAHGSDDLVAHARGLQKRFEELSDYVSEAAERLDGRMGVIEDRLEGAIAHAAVVRYDAYNEMSGRQSSSIALLDRRRSGIVLSSILHRDQARLYAKQVSEGRPEIELSPEEQEAVDRALAGARLPAGDA